jgi:hypothetical protein
VIGGKSLERIDLSEVTWDIEDLERGRDPLNPDPLVGDARPLKRENQRDEDGGQANDLEDGDHVPRHRAPDPANEPLPEGESLWLRRRVGRSSQLIEESKIRRAERRRSKK